MLSFQPSELAKFALVVYMSYYIAKKGERIRDFMNGLVPGLCRDRRVPARCRSSSRTSGPP